MIEYTYLIERDEGNRTIDITPQNYPRTLPNLCVLQGPNDSGKSTLLNLIALGLFGLKVPRLDGSLREQMRTYVDAPHQKVTFRFALSSTDGAYGIIAEKAFGDKSDISVREVVDGKERAISPEVLHQKINLIYDIPSNPTQRLSELVLEIKDLQQFYGFKVTGLKEYTLRVMDKVKDSLDPSRIKALTKVIEVRETALKELDGDSSGLTEKLQLLEQFYVAKRLGVLLQRREKRQQQIDRIKAQKKTVETKVFKADSQIRRKRSELEGGLEELRQRHASAILLLEPLLPKKSKQHLAIWERLDFGEMFKDLSFPPALRGQLTVFREFLSELKSGPDAERQREARMYRELVAILERYEDTNLELPIEGMKIARFLERLRSRTRELAAVERRLSEVESLETKLNEFGVAADRVESLFGGLRGMHEKFEGNYQEFTEESNNESSLAALGSDLQATRDSIQTLLLDAGKVGVTEHNHSEILARLEKSDDLIGYVDKSESELSTDVEALQQALREREREKRRLSTQQIVERAELKRAEKLAPHEYADRTEDLERVLKACQLLEGRLVKDFRGLCQALIEGGSPLALEKGSQSRYYEAVSRFLAKRLPTVRHGEEELQVMRVDLVNRVIETKNGGKIHLSDFGTGQGQSAYLQGRLSRSDNRRIVALIDEAAMMDSKSLGPVYEKLAQLNISGKLLLGIIVQRAERPEVVSLGA